MAIHKPEIYLQFCPIPCDKYITIQTAGAMLAKNYYFFQEIIDLILPILQKNDIKIVQLGGKNEQKLNGALDLLEKTTINQLAYLISKALLHIGTDSCGVHFASGFNIPIVALYSVSPPSICGPYFGDKSKQICLEPPMNGRKYSFTPTENPSPVNKISPEQVASSIMQLLNISWKSPVSTISLGSEYQNAILECIPNQVVQPFFNGVLNLRGDLFFNEQNI
ncbi:MAG: glycosyltransferase family 9 protein, partial [Nanoarchaeota archaeon]